MTKSDLYHFSSSLSFLIYPLAGETTTQNKIKIPLLDEEIDHHHHHHHRHHSPFSTNSELRHHNNNNKNGLTRCKTAPAMAVMKDLKDHNLERNTPLLMKLRELQPRVRRRRVPQLRPTTRAGAAGSYSSTQSSTQLREEVLACIKTGRPQIARRAIELAESRLSKDHWSEYYDGKLGRYVGKQARKCQTWSIADYLVAKTGVLRMNTTVFLQLSSKPEDNIMTQLFEEKSKKEAIILDAVEQALTLKMQEMQDEIEKRVKEKKLVAEINGNLMNNQEVLWINVKVRVRSNGSSNIVNHRTSSRR